MATQAGLTYVERRSPVGFGQHHVGVPLELAVETLEQIFEQQGDELPGQLQALVAVVVLVSFRFVFFLW